LDGLIVATSVVEVPEVSAKEVLFSVTLETRTVTVTTQEADSLPSVVVAVMVVEPDWFPAVTLPFGSTPAMELLLEVH